MIEGEIVEELITRWERIAHRKFHDAEHEMNDIGRRLIEHGAVCYANCARELRAALISALPVPSAIEATHRTLLPRLVSKLFPLLLPKWSHPLRRRGNHVPSK